MANKLAAAAIATAAVVGAQLSGGRYSPTPDHPRTASWYAALRKPSYTPPGVVFGIAWTALDALLGYSGYRLLTARRSVPRAAALASWAANLAGVAGFSWVLFGRKHLDEALGVTVAMVGTSAALVGTAASVDRKAGLAAAPLLGWVLFASLLQEEVWRKN